MAIDYAVRALTPTFQLGTGAFGGGTPTQFTLTGLRCEAEIEFALMPSPSGMTLRVYGMSLSHMNQLSRAGVVYAARQDGVLLQAGDAKNGMTTLFNGIITEAYPVFNQPETFFQVLASPANIVQLKPVAPSSFPVNATAATVLNQVAGLGGIKLENNGVNGVLKTPYFEGSAWDQARAALEAAGAFGYLDGVSNTLAVWPKGGSRAGAAVLIAAETGMIGYPSFQLSTIRVRVIYDPANLPQPGRNFTVRTGSKDGKNALIAANGSFNCVGLDLALSSQTEDGPWEALVTGASLAGPVKP